MNDTFFRGAYNARWIEPEEVAAKFIPIRHYQTLSNSAHSILLGPRGSGKTTLLKMLTRPALNIWKTKRSKEYKVSPFDYPDFEAIYIPADVRWLSEVNSIEKYQEYNKKLLIVIQRVFVSLGVFDAIMKMLPYIIGNNTIDEERLCDELNLAWGIKSEIPKIYQTRKSLHNLTIALNAKLNIGSEKAVYDFVENIPDIYYASALDAPIFSCDIISNLLGNKHNKKWALCYDELEIAPEWLRKEVYESLRSIKDQNYLLKLTSSPLLPSGLKTMPTVDEDFTPIRLWYSHIPDAKEFSDDLTKKYLSDKFLNQDVKPIDFFGKGIFYEKNDDPESDDVYGRSSLIYHEMKALAEYDNSFCDALHSVGLRSDDPYTDNQSIRDAFFRKIKPIVIVRRAFLKRDIKKGRSRKIPTIYSGKNAIYAMSEGNPRWLMGLLTDLYDGWRSEAESSYKENKPFIEDKKQAKILNSSARRFKNFLSAIGSEPFNYANVEYRSLWDFIEKIGSYFQVGILGVKFPLDPIASFDVDRNISNEASINIRKAIELGAFMYIGESIQDVSDEIKGQRYRLTHMLAPVFKLPFRTYSSILLSSVMAGINANQQQIFNNDY